jgi:hypothetical protein
MDNMVYWSTNNIQTCSYFIHTATWWFYFTIVSTTAMASGVTTRCARPGRQFVTELMSFMNFLFHSYTCCSDRHASPYWTFIHRWISMGFHPFTTLFFFGACCKRGGHLYPTIALSCCIPALYCHLSAILQPISIIAANLQGNRAVFQIFVALLRFLFDSTLYSVTTGNLVYKCGNSFYFASLHIN